MEKGTSVISTSVEDLSQLFEFFEAAITFQKDNGYEQWPRFQKEMILEEMFDQRHFKVMAQDGEVLGFFSIMYNDPVIWKEMDAEPSLYLHRIVVNPQRRGRQLMKVILDWAKSHAQNLERKYVRMDTWGHNTRLRDYYISCGYHYLGQQQLSGKDNEAAHYGGNYLSLFQNKV